MEIGDIGIFRKSGSLVEITRIDFLRPYGKVFSVVRVDTGKPMLIPAYSFEKRK